jgi:hypothetical protein
VGQTVLDEWHLDDGFGRRWRLWRAQPARGTAHGGERARAGVERLVAASSAAATCCAPPARWRRSDLGKAPATDMLLSKLSHFFG